MPRNGEVSQSQKALAKVGRPRKHNQLNMFYGIPAERVAIWCCVAVSTAYAYKTGLLKSGKSAAKLFRLHRGRRILIDE